MKLLVTMKLSDRSLANHIAPIASMGVIEDVFVVRDAPGPEIEKVTYVSPEGGRTRLPALAALAKLVRLVRVSLSEKPSLVHSYLFFPHGLLTLVAGKITGKKIGVSMIAGPVEVYSYGGSPLGSYSYCHPLPSSGPGYRVLLSLLRHFDIITVTGTFTKRFLTDRGFDPDRIFVLPHAVDDRFRPTGADKDIDVLFVGRLAPVKHVETLIRAIATVKEVLPSVRVAIVGDGESRGELQELSAALGLDDQIEFAGFQENAWDWYNRSRLSVLTSEREGFPYTVIESLRCGVPPIVSNCGDVADVVRDCFNGRIVLDYTDHRAFASVLTDLLTDPDRIAELAENCASSVEHLDSGAVVRVWADILATVEGQAGVDRSPNVSGSAESPDTGHRE